MTARRSQGTDVRLDWLKRWQRVFDRRTNVIARRLCRQADAARDARRFRDAAVLYEASLDLWPRPAIRVQAGHMFKETGDHDAAERHYLAAAEALPDDADLALQLGHFYKVSERPMEAATAYRRALAIRPEWGVAERELARLEAPVVDALATAAGDPATVVPERGERIVRALLPGAASGAGEGWLDTIEFSRLGALRERSEAGLLPLLSGIEAVRGVCASRQSFDRIEISLDGIVIHAAAPRAVPTERTDVTKFVFNLWIDLSPVPPGLHVAEVRLTGPGAETVSREDHVLVMAPLREADHPGADAVVEVDPDDSRPLDVRIRARPSMIRSAGSATLPIPRSILVLRTDQLGDVVISIPALKRLRALFPEARIVGLLTAANIDIARTLGLFDELIAVPFPDDFVWHRRVMTARDQEVLRARLAPYAFDLAIDLAVSQMSRALLLLSGAKFLYGFDGAWSWLSATLGGGSHDVKTRQAAMPQSGTVLALIERLGTMVDTGARVLRRDDLSPARLAVFGVEPGRYVVLHTGARIAFSRWHGYPQLARGLVEKTGLDVLVIGEDGGEMPTIDRVRRIEGRLDFDDFDALLSYCAGFVGNDSGPKHLAALRGVPVVSVHSARINWSEWGQEMGGTIISRRVPCAGCAIFHTEDECGKDFACIADIRVSEVLDALLAQLPDQATGAAAASTRREVEWPGESSASTTRPPRALTTPAPTTRSSV